MRLRSRTCERCGLTQICFVLKNWWLLRAIKLLLPMNERAPNSSIANSTVWFTPTEGCSFLYQVNPSLTGSSFLVAFNFSHLPTSKIFSNEPCLLLLGCLQNTTACSFSSSQSSGTHPWTARYCSVPSQLPFCVSVFFWRLAAVSTWTDDWTVVQKIFNTVPHSHAILL